MALVLVLVQKDVHTYHISAVLWAVKLAVIVVTIKPLAGHTYKSAIVGHMCTQPDAMSVRIHVYFSLVTKIKCVCA